MLAVIRDICFPLGFTTAKTRVPRFTPLCLSTHKHTHTHIMQQLTCHLPCSFSLVAENLTDIWRERKGGNYEDGVVLITCEKMLFVLRQNESERKERRCIVKGLCVCMFICVCLCMGGRQTTTAIHPWRIQPNNYPCLIFSRRGNRHHTHAHTHTRARAHTRTHTHTHTHTHTQTHTSLKPADR